MVAEEGNLKNSEHGTWVIVGGRELAKDHRAGIPPGVSSKRLHSQRSSGSGAENEEWFMRVFGAWIAWIAWIVRVRPVSERKMPVSAKLRTY